MFLSHSDKETLSIKSVTYRKVKQPLSKLNIFQSAALGKLHLRILKKCAKEFSKMFVLIFHTSGTTGEFPEDWQKAHEALLFTEQCGQPQAD